jgi:8-oxo-dGTP diphosphatase
MKQRKQDAFGKDISMISRTTKIIAKKGVNLRAFESPLVASLLLNLILVLALAYFISQKSGLSSSSKASLRSTQSEKNLVSNGKYFHGGHPEQDRPGSCWCGGDMYCMCTPSLAIDLIIASGPEHVLVVRRKDTNQLAVMGGFVKVGESVESAVRRELMEEMGIDINNQVLQLFGVYSDPRRDNRRATASAVFLVHVPEDQKAHAADDAKDVKRLALSEIEGNQFFADHKSILMDYIRSIKKTEIKAHQDGDFAMDISRSLCSKEI